MTHEDEEDFLFFFQFNFSAPVIQRRIDNPISVAVIRVDQSTSVLFFSPHAVLLDCP